MSEYVGFDVSKEETAFCVKDKDGKVLARGKVATDPQALFEVLKEHCLCPERVVMETGTLCVNGGAKLVHPGGAKLVHLTLCGTRCWGVVPVVHRRDPRCFE